MNPSMNDLLLNRRALFMVEGCHFCNKWKQFIQRYNMNVSPKKMIQIVDCTRYHDYGVIENNLIKLFAKFIKGSYPVLFFDGIRVDGASTRGELEQWAKILLEDDFLIEENIDFKYTPHCHYEKKLFKGEIIACE